MSVENWLSELMKNLGAVAGTVHYKRGDQLELACAVNIPEKVQLLTRQIPKGKGMAGLAWERGEAVQTCNLQQDKSGDVRPGAKAVNAQAAVALPVNGANGELRAVVGVAFMDERELTAAELERYSALAHELPPAE